MKHETIKSIRHQTNQPEQLIIRLVNGNTLLIFKSGAFRIMGKNDSLDNHFDVYLLLSQISNVVPEIILQTMTASYNFKRKINLNKLADEPNTHYTAEFFPAVHITKFKPVHVNVFSTGRVTVCGIKDILDCNIIKLYLDNVVCKYFV